ncbi:hypothetical protein [Ectobacillus ponti]|uniref:Uncharacterized protein n=1 Tax=Ectobacillus ponti TaxID=2961894 RepID=A0AA41X830_9BACI|nr:hypothetical protein [Ectobacillus ponti]MCP8970626.1 hypothetical protein [Ectobacillus ponti]
MTQAREIQELYPHHYAEVGISFLGFVLGGRVVEAFVEAAASSDRSKGIVEALNGSQAGFLQALRSTIRREEMEQLQCGVYSKQHDASANPVFYVSLQFKDEKETVLLGESFFRPCAAMTEEELLGNAQIVEALLHALAKFKTAMVCAATVEEVVQVLEEQTEWDTNEDAVDGAFEDEELQAEEEDKMSELFWKETVREAEAAPEQAVQAAEAESDTYGEQDIPEAETADALEQLNDLVLELYKKSSGEDRQLIKRLRADLFEIEAAIDLGEDAPLKAFQFHQQALSLQFHTVEELQLQIRIAQQSLALLTNENM